MPRLSGYNRPSANAGNQDVAAVTALSQSNSTAAHFLRTAQKPWMNSTAVPISVRVKDGPLQTAGNNVPQGIPAASSAVTMETPQEKSTATPPVETNLSPSLSQCNIHSAERHYALSPVLPSPAPTDDLGGTPNIGQARLAALSNNSADEPEVAYGAAISPTPTNVPTNSSSLQEEDIFGSPTISMPDQPNLQTPGGRKRSFDDGLAEWSKRSRTTEAPDTQGLNPSNGRQLQQPFPTPHPSLACIINNPSLATSMANQAFKIREFVMSKLHTSPPLNTLDQQRCKLLEDACLSNDFFYVALHKLCCSARMAQVTGWPIQHLEPDHLEGVRKLEILIRPNSELSPNALAFFAEFPRSLDENHSELHRRVFESVRIFLRRLSDGWDRYRKACEERGYPLFVDEMIVGFQLTSHLLQSIVFRSIHRHITKPEDHDLNIRVEKLLEVDQKAYLQRRPRPHPLSPQQIRIESHRLGERYQRIVLARAAERQRLAGNMTHTSPNTSTCPNVNLSFQNGPALPVAYSQQPHFNLNNYGQALRSASVQDLSQFHRTSRPASCARSYSLNNWFPANRLTMARSQPPMNQDMVSNPFHIDPRPVIYSDPKNPPATRKSSQVVVPPLPHNVNQPQVPASVNKVPSTPTPSIALPHRASLSGPVPQNTYNLVPVPQSDIRISRFQKLNRNGTKDANLRLYQHFERLKTQVIHLGNTQTSFTFQFEISRDDWERKVADVLASPGDTSRTRLYGHGKLLFRLRCVRCPQQTHEVVENQWVVNGQCWPRACFVEINGCRPEIPKRDTCGKDLPLDLTTYVIPGVNILDFSLIRDVDESTGGNKFYAIAVEAVAVSDDKGIKDQISKMEMQTSLKSMTKALQPKDDDEDLVIVDPVLSVDVVDPFSATIFDVPVRGIRCPHRECFDLDNFLQTRKSRRTGAPCGADEWKCPICGADSRPSQLVIDGFLLHVRSKLEESGKLSARAILIQANGDWDVKVENHSEILQAESRLEGLLDQSEADAADQNDEPAVVIDLDGD